MSNVCMPIIIVAIFKTIQLLGQLVAIIPGVKRANENYPNILRIGLDIAASLYMFAFAATWFGYGSSGLKNIETTLKALGVNSEATNTVHCNAWLANVAKSSIGNLFIHLLLLFAAFLLVSELKDSGWSNLMPRPVFSFMFVWTLYSDIFATHPLINNATAIALISIIIITVLYISAERHNPFHQRYLPLVMLPVMFIVPFFYWLSLGAVVMFPFRYMLKRSPRDL